MSRYSNEFWVGLLSIFAAVAVGWAITRIDDHPNGASSYTLVLNLPSADGLYTSTPVKVAGVSVGSVSRIELTGSTARVELLMQGDVQLPKDSIANVKASGVLGDKLLSVNPGKAPELLKDGDTIQVNPPTSDIDALTQKIALIADDVKAITGSLRTLMGDAQFTEKIQHIVGNLDALSTDLRSMAADNRSELNVIAGNLLEVSQVLKAAILTTSHSVEEEMAAVRVATEALNRTMGNVEEISAKINRGDGTIGQLVNDKTPMEQVTATLGQVNEVVGQVNDLVSDANRIQTDVYYRGSYYFGTDPSEGAFDQNPVAGSMRNVVGVKIQPREDYWYDAAFTTHPLGTFTYTDHYFDGLDSSYREYTRRPDYRFTFQFAKRFDNLVLRFGIKESSGGFGADYLLLNDKLVLSADVYDFTYASWPLLDQSPNLAVNVRAWPWRFLYLEAGADNVIFGARHGFFTGYAGGGFTFNDQDLKLILPAIPIKP